MAIDVTAEVEVLAARSKAAALVEDPANDLGWIRAVKSSEQLPGVEGGVGLRGRRVAKMMGRSINYTTEVCEYDPGTRLVMKSVDGPFPMTVTYSFTDSPKGTFVTVRNRGGAGAMFAICAPIIGRLVHSRVRGDLEALKSAVETVA